MDMKFVSDDIDSISLHDCDISEFKFGEDIELIFEDGFDVASPNPLNGTGRHKRTGEAAVVLKNGRYVSGEMSFGRRGRGLCGRVPPYLGERAFGASA